MSTWDSSVGLWCLQSGGTACSTRSCWSPTDATWHFWSSIKGRRCVLFTEHCPLAQAVCCISNAGSPHSQRHLSALVEFLVDVHCPPALIVLLPMHYPDLLQLLFLLASILMNWVNARNTRDLGHPHCCYQFNPAWCLSNAWEPTCFVMSLLAFCIQSCCQMLTTRCLTSFMVSHIWWVTSLSVLECIGRLHIGRILDILVNQTKFIVIIIRSFFISQCPTSHFLTFMWISLGPFLHLKVPSIPLLSLTGILDGLKPSHWLLPPLKPSCFTGLLGLGFHVT